MKTSHFSAFYLLHVIQEFHRPLQTLVFLF